MGRILYVLFFIIPFSLSAQYADYVKKNYSKAEYLVPMRDDKKLFTIVYTPRDTSQQYPVLIMRTPYSVKPYEPDIYPETLGPSKYLCEDKFIFVYQDVRGKFMSEGKFLEMTPHIPVKKSNKDVDNSTDTFDTVEWLLKHLKHHNGKVGLWGISYPGFYAATGIIDAHPAIKCASPQAPIANWFIGDDMHHNGAFALSMSYNFFEVTGIHPDTAYKTFPKVNNYPVKDAYNFFLNIGPLNKVNKKYFNNAVPIWDSIVKHDTYDKFWQERNTLPHLQNITTAVMTVGGWFDGEDLYGTIHTYKSIEQKNPGIYNIFVMGPWIHGGWARTKGDSLGNISFGSLTSDYYQQEIELKFFNYYLKNKGDLNLPEVLVFETGTNTWKEYDQWPPSVSHFESLYFHGNNHLKSVISEKTGFYYDEYTSDPMNPVPYTQVFHSSRMYYNKEYMVEDQRFTACRPDVLYYQTEKLDEAVTIVGPVNAELFVSTTASDADWVVKLIDIFPDTLNTIRPKRPYTDMAGFQMLVRGEILRGKFRDDDEKPKSFSSNKVEQISITLQDVNHTFKKGHKIMIQVQSSWFPLFDRNPQKFMNIFEATAKDFQYATQRVYHSKNYPSSINFRVIH